MSITLICQMQINSDYFQSMAFILLHHRIFFCRKTDRIISERNQRTGDDEESSNEISPVVNDSFSLKNNGKISLANGRPDTMYTSSDASKSMLYADPWIPRSDQPLSSNLVYNDDQRQKSIQYETRLYYHSLSSTSDEHLSQQQRQPLLNNIDKDIEYVESRLRGQTTVSLPASHSNSYTHDVNWRRRPRLNVMDISPFSSEQRQTPRMHQKYPTISQSESTNETNLSLPKLVVQKSLTPTPISTNGSVKTVKSRMEKMKDQKAAKTLR